jgi:hypothetical protein
MNNTVSNSITEVRALIEEARRLEADAYSALSDASYKLVRADNCRRRAEAVKVSVVPVTR